VRRKDGEERTNAGPKTENFCLMILFNKLVRTDLVLLIAVILLFVVRTGFWVSFLEGFGAAVLFISLANHIQHYQRTKKLY
jgi:hypothetical protein